VRSATYNPAPLHPGLEVHSPAKARIERPAIRRGHSIPVIGIVPAILRFF
jgi:hypothetical protein